MTGGTIPTTGMVRSLSSEVFINIYIIVHWLSDQVVDINHRWLLCPPSASYVLVEICRH